MSERFVDVDEHPIPPKSTWGQLTPTQLIDVRNRLMERSYFFRNNKQILKMMQQSVKELDDLISSRSTF
jgi:hypothetical protein